MDKARFTVMEVSDGLAKWVRPFGSTPQADLNVRPKAFHKVYKELYQTDELSDDELGCTATSRGWKRGYSKSHMDLERSDAT
jgi:hypothetical protein